MKILNYITKSRFAKNEKGNISVIAAITAPVVLMIGFGAVDYGFVVRAQQDLQSAASAAALAAVNEAEIVYESREDVDMQKLVEETATNYFNSRIGDMQNVEMSSIKVVPEIKNNVFSVDISYSASIKSSAMSLVGQEKYTVANTTSAKTSVRSYVNFNFLFDVSASMGVGATDADMQIMKDKIGCAFSCHLGKARGSSTYDKAKAAGAEMRIDVARKAAENAIDVMIEKSEVPDHMTVGLHIYDNEMTSYLHGSDSKASDLSYVKGEVEEAVQMNLEYGGTNTQYAIEELVKTLPDSGSGLTKDDRIQYIIVLTDGVENPQYWRSGKGWKAHPEGTPNDPYEKFANHEYEYALDPKACDGAKKKDIEIFFINTEYLVPNWSQSSHNTKRFGFIEDTLHDLVPKRFAECAGDNDHVVNASSPEEIKKAFEQLVGDLSTPLRLY